MLIVCLSNPNKHYKLGVKVKIEKLMLWKKRLLFYHVKLLFKFKDTHSLKNGKNSSFVQQNEEPNMVESVRLHIKQNLKNNQAKFYRNHCVR